MINELKYEIKEFVEIIKEKAGDIKAAVTSPKGISLAIKLFFTGFGTVVGVAVGRELAQFGIPHFNYQDMFSYIFAQLAEHPETFTPGQAIEIAQEKTMGVQRLHGQFASEQKFFGGVLGGVAGGTVAGLVGHFVATDVEKHLKNQQAKAQ